MNTQTKTSTNHKTATTPKTPTKPKSPWMKEFVIGERVSEGARQEWERTQQIRRLSGKNRWR